MKKKTYQAPCAEWIYTNMNGHLLGGISLPFSPGVPGEEAEAKEVFFDEDEDVSVHEKETFRIWDE